MSVVGLTGMCLSFTLGALAAWQVRGDSENVLTMGSCKNEIREQYKRPDHVNPSEKIQKTVNIVNTGDVDTLVRVTLTREIGTVSADGSFVEDKTLDPARIVLNTNQNYWKKDGEYFYYKEVLKAESQTKEPLLMSYQLSADAGNDYRNKEVHIVVNMESVQAEGGAEKLWGVNFSSLGVAVPKTIASRKTSVLYNGRENGFTVSEQNADLFADFKNLLPGCGRSQEIEIGNKSDETAEIFLHAEPTDQEKMTEKQLKLVEKMLQEYAVIDVYCGEDRLYHGPVSGNNTQQKQSMVQPISLGEYRAGETKKLTVKLAMDSRMDNQYMDLSGKVRWVFTVSGEETSETGKDSSGAIYPAKTGVNDDSLRRYLYAFFGFSAAWGVGMEFPRKNRRHKGRKEFEKNE